MVTHFALEINLPAH